MRKALVLLAFLLPGAGFAWIEPERGTQERRDLMDAFRPLAERLYGAPVQFVVGALRVHGDVAFAAVSVQRPGGAAIDLTATPGWRDGYFMEDADNHQGQALYVRSGRMWVALHWTFGATDVWWADPALCPRFGAVIPEVCP